MKNVLIIILLIIGSVTYGQEAQFAKYKSMFILNFIRYIGWPEAAKEGDFVIGVVSDDMVLSNLQSQTVGRKFGYQNIVVKEFTNIEDVTDCQILYLSGSLNIEKNAAIVMQKLNGKNSLIIASKEGAINSGVMINFVIRDGKLKFELSQANAEKFGLKFSSSLTSLSNAIVK